MGSRGAAFLYLEALNLQAMATPAEGAGRGGCQRRELLGMCAARRQNSVTQLLVYLSSCARTVHSPSPPCVQTSLRESTVLPAPDRFPAFAAELALLLGDFDRGIPTRSLPPPLGLRRRQIGECRSYITPSASSDECCGCCRGHCTLPERQLRPQVGATNPKPKPKSTLQFCL